MDSSITRDPIKEEKKVTEKRKRVMYLRDEDGKPTGVMVAIETDSETLRFGMVRYHPVKEHLPFTKKKAKEIAFDRAAKCTYQLPYVKSRIKLNRIHVVPEKLERYVMFFAKQALERLGLSKFENLFDPISGSVIRAN
jgi:hypothetical protein